MQLGTLVTGVTYRNPSLLAKQIATLDSLSGGRAILGIGAAWYEEEHEAYGWEFPPVRERFAMLREAVAICRGMFDEETFTYTGEHFHVVGARVVPRPLRRIPIMIGGSGEKVTLRLVAELADLCNIGGTAPVVTRKLAALDAHCDAIGRDPATVTRTAMVSLFVCANESDRDGLRQLVGYDNPEVVRPDDHRHGGRGHRAARRARHGRRRRDHRQPPPRQGRRRLPHRRLRPARRHQLNRQPFEAGRGAAAAAPARAARGFWRGSVSSLRRSRARSRGPGVVEVRPDRTAQARGVRGSQRK